MAVATHAETHAEPKRQFMEPALIGMYIFITSEVMFFGSLFAAYFYLYGSQIWPPALKDPSIEYVPWFPIPTINTIILFSSAFTCHFAVEGLKHGNRRQFFGLLIFTLFLGGLFEVGQAYEFYHAWTNGLTFQLNNFASAFFTMTGFHGAHVLGGLLLLGLVLGRGLRGQFNAKHSVFVDAATLYWHFVDVVWAFLFAVLYIAVTYGK